MRPRYVSCVAFLLATAAGGVAPAHALLCLEDEPQPTLMPESTAPAGLQSVAIGADAFSPAVESARAEAGERPERVACIPGLRAADPGCQVHDPVRRSQGPDRPDTPTRRVARDHVSRCTLPPASAHLVALPAAENELLHPGYAPGVFRPPRA